MRNVSGKIVIKNGKNDSRPRIWRNAEKSVNPDFLQGGRGIVACIENALKVEEYIYIYTYGTAVDDTTTFGFPIHASPDKSAGRKINAVRDKSSCV